MLEYILIVENSAIYRCFLKKNGFLLYSNLPASLPLSLGLTTVNNLITWLLFIYAYDMVYRNYQPHRSHFSKWYPWLLPSDKLQGLIYLSIFITCLGLFLKNVIAFIAPSLSATSCLCLCWPFNDRLNRHFLEEVFHNPPDEGKLNFFLNLVYVDYSICHFLHFTFEFLQARLLLGRVYLTFH